MKILLVEDMASLRNSIEAALKEEGYAVDVADRGDEALAKWQACDYGLVILDVMLPDIDGFKILQVMRKTRQTPVLMLTARDSIRDRVRGLDFGADDYLTKPFDLLELMARLRALVRRGSDNRSPVIEVGKVALDTIRKYAYLEEVRVELTSREYAILETLVRLRGQVVSRTMLYEHLYSEDETTLSNVLDVYIFRLRNKFGKEFIKTRRGFGYIIEEEA